MKAGRGTDPIAPLWRAAQAFRLLSCLYALGFQIAVNPDLTRPGLAWTLCAVLLGWSAACAVAYLRGFGRRPAWVLAEIAIVIALMGTNRLVASAQWAADNQTWPTTLWATNPILSAALLFGPAGGMLTGLAVMATNFAVKNYFTLNFAHNATPIIEIALGLAIGMAAQTARRAHAELQQAIRLSAATRVVERRSHFTITDRQLEMRWQAGVPALGGTLEGQSGRILTLSREKIWALSDRGRVEPVVDYKFNSREGRDLIRLVARQQGLRERLPLSLTFTLIVVAATPVTFAVWGLVALVAKLFGIHL
jgi:Family of unknown function (DUF5931)